MAGRISRGPADRLRYSCRVPRSPTASHRALSFARSGFTFLLHRFTPPSGSVACVPDAARREGPPFRIPPAAGRLSARGRRTLRQSPPLPVRRWRVMRPTARRARIRCPACVRSGPESSVAHRRPHATGRGRSSVRCQVVTGLARPDRRPGRGSRRCGEPPRPQGNARRLLPALFDHG